MATTPYSKAPVHVQAAILIRDGSRSTPSKRLEEWFRKAGEMNMAAKKKRKKKKTKKTEAAAPAA